MLTVSAEDDQPVHGLIYLIPGNPGLSGFYADFLQDLHKDRPNHEIVCGDHLGMDVNQHGVKQYDGIPRVYTLDEQVKHHSRLILEQISRSIPKSSLSKDFQVVVMGHSMGCWLLQRTIPIVVSGCEQQSITTANIKIQTIMLTPTIHDIDKSPNGVSLTFLLRFLDVARILAFLSYYLPTKLLELFVRIKLARTATGSGIQTAVSMALRPQLLYQMCSLAAEEMTVISGDSDKYKPFWEWAKPSPGSVNNVNTVTMILSAKDHWVGTETTNYLLRTYSQLPHVLMEVQDDIPHSFCLSHSQPVAKRVIECMWP